MPDSTSEFTIAGAGLTGALAAVMLARRGAQVTVFESRSDPTLDTYEGGRSINLALSRRGIEALKRVALLDEVMQIALPMHARLMHDIDGHETEQPYGIAAHEINYSVSRALLSKILLTSLRDYDNVELYFDHDVQGCDLDAQMLAIKDKKTSQHKFHHFAHLLATDGIYSAVRMNLEQQGVMDFTLDTIDHAYKEIAIPPGSDLSNRHLHIWPREQFMMIALPNPDETFTATLFLARDKGEEHFAKLTSPSHVEAFFTQYFPDIAELVPDYLSQFNEHPTSDLKMVRGGPWHLSDKVCLLGDSAHAIVPFHGQGMNTGFEDVSVLEDLLNTEPDIASVFARFEQQRRPDTDAIAELSMDNYIEMRDNVGDARFLERKALERRLMRDYPEQYIPAYNLIHFHTVPYRYAQFCGKIQDRYLNRFCALEARNALDSEQIDALMAAYLNEIESFHDND